MRYTIEVKWSEDDQKYAVILPEWEGRYLMPVVGGTTYEQAMARGVNALENITEEAKEYGDALPEPATFQAG